MSASAAKSSVASLCAGRLKERALSMMRLLVPESSLRRQRVCLRLLRRCKLRAAKRKGFHGVSVERRAIEPWRVARLQLHCAIAEREAVRDQRRARLQEAVHF